MRTTAQLNADFRQYGDFPELTPDEQDVLTYPEHPAWTAKRDKPELRRLRIVTRWKMRRRQRTLTARRIATQVVEAEPWTPPHVEYIGQRESESE